MCISIVSDKYLAIVIDKVILGASLLSYTSAAIKDDIYYETNGKGMNLVFIPFIISKHIVN